MACQAKTIDDAVFLAAADALAHQVSQKNLDAATLCPSLSDIREVSLHIAVTVAEKVYQVVQRNQNGHDDVMAYIKSTIYLPHY